MNHTNHQIIQRQQSYVLDRKLVTIHSDDRDISKWTLSNHFEIVLPETITNVQSMRLAEICFPANYYTFSNQSQNTKLTFKLEPKDASASWYNILLNNQTNNYSIEIQEGFFNPDQLANEIANKMNKAIEAYLVSQGASPSNYAKFTVRNDSVGQKFWFGNTVDSFILTFDVQNTYTFATSQCAQPTKFGRYNNWGLPSYIGFKKVEYNATATLSAVTFEYNDAGLTNWLVPDAPIGALNAYFVQAPMVYKIFGENTIYMELDKYNSMSELVPYSEATSNLYNNDCNGTIKAAFAKIPVTNLPHAQIFDSRNGFLQNISHYDPPIERIQKLKFKFRTHDGSLVDFQDFPVNFTIEFNTLRNEMGKQYNLRIPATYGL